jgi:CRISPR-associated RAMP protein (TIGR02581 family)
MFKKLYNQVKLDIKISPNSPLLIKSGEEGLDPTLPSMQFVRTYNKSCGETVYIPGSSLKGVLRSYVEKLLRTISSKESFCCDIFNENSTCRNAEKDDRNIPTWEIYKRNCYACKLFGSTTLASRIKVSDLYPVNTEEIKTEVRMGVAINRKKGSVAVGPFDMEMVVSGTFSGTIIIKNYQLWQLALIGQAILDIDSGYQQIGYGKSRGLGFVSCKVDSIEFEYYSPMFSCLADNNIIGIGCIDEEKERYRLLEKDLLTSEVKLTPTESNPIRRVYKLEGAENSEKLFKGILESESYKELVSKGKSYNEG